MSKVTSQDLEAFVRLFEASDWDQVDIELDDFALHLSKNAQPSLYVENRTTPVESAEAPTKRAVIDQSAAARPVALVPAQPVVPDGWLSVKAPHLGTFYLSPKPGAPPYIEVGQTVGAETEVCLLEVMKLFTTLRAGVSGVVRQICAKDSLMVESGDILLLIEPKS